MMRGSRLKKSNRRAKLATPITDRRNARTGSAF